MTLLVQNPPRTVADLTPPLLTELLGGAFPGAVVASARPRSTHQGTTTHVHLDLTYEAGSPADAPQQVFVKTELSTVDDLPDEFVTALSEGSEGASILLAEQRFYREIAPSLDLELLRVFASEPVPGPAQFLILAEDVTQRGATFPDPAGTQTPDQVAALLRTLAHLHAPFWDSPRLRDGGDLAWLDSPVDGLFTAFLRTDGWALIRMLLDEPYKVPLLEATGLDADGMEKAFWASQEVFARDPRTLLHGDPHPGNVYRLPDGTTGLLDWQLVRRGSWVHDVAYAIVGALDPSVRAAAERDLLAGYLAELRHQGIAAPVLDDAYALYRCAPPWGFAMWAIAPGVMYSDALIGAVLERFAVAIRELGTAEQLGL
ncbi:MAG TPA: phosphotransferase [Mycobacteriales bacterium]|nr:phosphotransferase [Mycobacteriales bacterium]